MKFLSILMNTLFMAGLLTPAVCADEYGDGFKYPYRLGSESNLYCDGPFMSFIVEGEAKDSIRSTLKQYCRRGYKLRFESSKCKYYRHEDCTFKQAVSCYVLASYQCK